MAYLNGENKDLNTESLENVYNRLLSIYNTTDSEKVLTEIGTIFRSIPDYKDSRKLAIACFSKAKDLEKKNTYEKAMHYYEKGDIPSLNIAISEFNKIPGYLNSKEMAAECRKQISSERYKQRKEMLEKQRLETNRSNQSSDTLRMIMTGIAILASLFTCALLWYQYF